MSKSSQGQPPTEKVPATLLDPIQIEEIRVSYWQMLFEAIGYPMGLKAAGLTHEGIVEALAAGRTSPALVEALETIRELGESGGQEALVDALADEGIALKGPEDEGPKELALRLFIEQRKKPELGQPLLRALASVYERGGRRSLQEFAGKDSRPLPAFLEKARLLRDELARWCVANAMDDYAQVRAFEDQEDRGVHFLAVHGHRLETPVTIQEGGRGVIRMRRAIFDSIRYDPRMGRLKIGARTQALTRMYQGLCGRIFFGDDTFFALAVPCTLKPLQRKGQVALDSHRVPQIARATLREALWDVGGDRLWVRSRDCFGRMEKHGLARQEAELIEAKIELLLTHDNRNGRISVTVRVPDRIDFRHDRHEQIVERYLDEIGVRLPSPDGEHRDLWDLYPWEHSEKTWRSSYGSSVDAMRQAGILMPVGLAAIPDDTGVPGNLLVEALKRDGRHGIAQSGDATGRLLTATDISGLRLDILQVGRQMAQDLGVSGGTKELAPGLIDLGSRSFGTAAFRAFLLSRAPADAGVLATQVRLAAKGALPVVIAPAGRSLQAGIAEVEINGLSPPFSLLLSDVVRALQLDENVPATLLAKPGDRLIVDGKHGKAWLDGVELDLNPDTHPFKLLHRLACASPNAVSAEQVSRELSAASLGDLHVTKQAKADLLKKIRASFSSVDHREPPNDLSRMIVTPRSGYYQLTIPCFRR